MYYTIKYTTIKAGYRKLNSNYDKIDNCFMTCYLVSTYLFFFPENLYEDVRRNV